MSGKFDKDNQPKRRGRPPSQYPNPAPRGNPKHAIYGGELTPQQEIFVREYLIDMNGQAAWIRAGGSPVTAAQTVSKMMRKGTAVQIAVARAMAERSIRTGITSDRVLQEIAKVAFGDPRVLFREDGSLRPPHEYSPDDAAMIESVKTRRIVEVGIDPDNPGKQKLVPVEIQEVKLASKMTALQALMRHLGLNNDKLDVTINTPLAQRLQEAYRRTGRGELTARDGDVVDVEYEDVTDATDESGGQKPQNDDLADLLR